MTSSIIIEVKNLSKLYDAVPAVDGISFSLCKGQLMAILGANGAGKSSLINILCTETGFDKGSVKIAGKELRKDSGKIRKDIGVVFQRGVLDDKLTILENLRVRGSIYGIKGKALEQRICEVAEFTNIENIMDKCYGRLSGGQQRRCDIARAMIHKPQILFLDEPTAGLDPEIRNNIWKTINKIRVNTSMTTVATTHYLEEVNNADKIIIMKEGKIIFDGKLDEMRGRYDRIYT